MRVVDWFSREWHELWSIDVRRANKVLQEDWSNLIESEDVGDSIVPSDQYAKLRHEEALEGLKTRLDQVQAQAGVLSLVSGLTVLILFQYPPSGAIRNLGYGSALVAIYYVFAMCSLAFVLGSIPGLLKMSESVMVSYPDYGRPEYQLCQVERPASALERLYDRLFGRAPEQPKLTHHGKQLLVCSKLNENVAIQHQNVAVGVRRRITYGLQLLIVCLVVLSSPSIDNAARVALSWAFKQGWLY